MTKFSESVIGKIKCENIAPFPRWCFLLKSYVFWLMLVVSVILGSISFSVIVHIASFGDFDMIDHLGGNPITSAVMLLPYFWILSLIIFALVAFYNWKHTKLGYRFRRRWIFIASIVASISLGSVMHAFGLGKEIDMLMVNSMPFYEKSKSSARQKLWLQPENGLLVGEVINVDEFENIVVIKDDSGRSWEVDDITAVSESDDVVKEGKIVKIIGKKEGKNKFQAKEIRRCVDCREKEAGGKSEKSK